MRHRWFTCVRLSDSYLTVSIPPFNHIVHDLAVASSAACGSLKSAPVGRFRWTYHHLRYSIAFRFKRFLGTLQVACWHKSLKGECIRPGTPLSLEDARRLVDGYVEHYNDVRLNSAIGYITPKDMLAGRQ